VEITINTPALLFPATSLLMISYTTRFLHLANLIRNLHASGVRERPISETNPEPSNAHPSNSQHAGRWVTSLLLCVISMFLLFGSQVRIAQICFAASLAFMIVSLLLSLWEIWISVDALNLHLKGIQEGKES
jgi:hypothetical protein